MGSDGMGNLAGSLGVWDGEVWCELWDVGYSLDGYRMINYVERALSVFTM
jgi:hypothetical protein